MVSVLRCGVAVSLRCYRQALLLSDDETEDWMTARTKAQFFCILSIGGLGTGQGLGWRLSNALEARFCVNAMKKAVTAYCKFRMVDTDRHSIVTSSRVVCQICPAQ